MSNENGLTAFGAIPFSPAALAKPKGQDLDKGYFPRLHFISTGSGKLAGDGDGKISVGHWGVVEGDKVLDLGEQVTIIPLVHLDKAVDFGSDDTIVVFGEETPGYQEIVDQVKALGYDSSCMYGPLFLCFLVETCQFVELFLNNTSGRNEADNIKAFLPIPEAAAKAAGVEPRAPRPATLGSKAVTSKSTKMVNGKKVTKKYDYNVPTTSEGPKTLNVETPPTNEQVAAACASFVKQTVVEEEDREDR